MKEADLDPRQRILLEIERLKRQIYNCDHCLALKNQIAELVNVLPPEPIVNYTREQYLALMDAGTRKRWLEGGWDA